MVQISGMYRHERDENVMQFFKEVGVSQELIEKATQPDATVEVLDKGNSHEFKISFGVTLTYVLNEEFDEPMLKGAKGIATRQGDNIHVTTKTSDGRCINRVYEFTDDGFTAVLRMGDLTAKRCYKRI